MWDWHMQLCTKLKVRLTCPSMEGVGHDFDIIIWRVVGFSFEQVLVKKMDEVNGVMGLC